MPAGTPGGKIPDYTRRQAVNLFRVRRPWDAVRLAERRLAEQPDDAVARGILAQALQHVTFVREPLRPAEWTSRAGHTREALLKRGLEEVTHAVGSRPDDPWLHAIRATILDDLERWAEAEDSIREALRVDPRNHHDLILLSSIQAHSGRLDAACRTAEHAVELDPEDSTAWLNLAFRYANADRWVDTERAASSSLALNPGFYLAHMMLGVALAHQDRLGEALPALEAACRLDPANPAPRHNLEHARKLVKDSPIQGSTSPPAGTNASAN